MSEDDSEATISITLVDGISCGLAGALLLFVIFGVNLSAATSTLGGSAGQGTATKLPTGLTSEPVDIIVEIDGIASTFPTSNWSDSTDHMVVDRAGLRTVFVRELERGFTNIAGTYARASEVAFSLTWDANSPPSGSIHVFRSGVQSSVPFSCQQLAGPYQIISRYELVYGVIDGDCF